MSVVMRTESTAFVAVYLNDGKLAREFPRPLAASAKPAKREERVVRECQAMILLGLTSFTSQVRHKPLYRPFRQHSWQFSSFTSQLQLFH